MKKEFEIITDSTTDLPQALVDKLNIKVIPLKYTINDITYENHLDYRNQDINEFYDLIKKGNPTSTSQLVPKDYDEVLIPILEKGKDVLILSFSSKLSGTYNSGVLAVNDLKEKYPNQKITIIDTKSASLGEGLLVYLTANKVLEGASFDEVVNFVNETIPKVAHWFTVDDITHLKRSGRISGLSSFVAKTLSIKPIMHTDDTGSLIPRRKVISRKRAIKALFEKMVETALEDQKDVFIGHGDDLAAAETLKSYVLEKYPDVNIIINNIGPVIGSHTGQGVLALFFLANKR